MSEIKTVRTQGTPPHIPVIEPLSIINNGTYTAPSGVDGYSPITVDVQEQPWQPLEDGYSNFWFELTDDTLSPWLNFSAKNNDAVIDWGDGSGEVALDTLTPTHTYAKAGKYVVKVKGVTGIARQHTIPYNSQYFSALQYAELNSEISSIGAYAFSICVALKEIRVENLSVSIANHVFYLCSSLLSTALPANANSTTMLGAQYQACLSLTNAIIPNNIETISNNVFTQCVVSITIPATVTSIGNSALQYCNSLSEIHIQATTPPELGTNVFSGLASNYVIYVPVGTGDTYKAAGWSAYSDHIVEEGQTLSKAALRRIQAAEKGGEASPTTEDMR